MGLRNQSHVGQALLGTAEPTHQLFGSRH
jgi:hypothetical protein